MFDIEEIDWSIVVLIFVAVIIAAVVLFGMKKRKAQVSEAVVGVEQGFTPEELPATAEPTE